MLFLITGNGKGKTTSALGMSLRMIGSGGSVFFLQFIKGKEYGGVKALKTFDNVELHVTGREKFLKRDADQLDKELAIKGWNLFKDALKRDFSLYVLDELNIALNYELLPLHEVIEVLKEEAKRKDIVVTGRYAKDEMKEIANMISDITEVKHHYHDGIKARKGIEF